MLILCKDWMITCMAEVLQENQNKIQRDLKDNRKQIERIKAGKRKEKMKKRATLEEKKKKKAAEFADFDFWDLKKTKTLISKFNKKRKATREKLETDKDEQKKWQEQVVANKWVHRANPIRVIDFKYGLQVKTDWLVQS